MSSDRPEERWFSSLAEESDAAEATRVQTPSRLKSKVYSALVNRQQASGPLLSLPKTKAAGEDLCVFEELVRICPTPQQAKSFYCCSVCHARVLAERVENAPIFWGHCPYVRFQNR